MTEEIKKNILKVIHYYDVPCECLSKSFSVADDGTILCQNCKRRFDLALSEIN